jgi:ProP effector
MTKPTDIISILAEWFPHAFAVYERRRRPLKIGVHVDILERTGGAIEPRELARALRYYTANTGYLRSASRPGAERVDLDGKPAGVVTPEQAEATRLRLSLRKQRIDAGTPPSAKAAPGIQPPTPKRLSLADLRAAAQQRRQAAAQSEEPRTQQGDEHARRAKMGLDCGGLQA